MEKFFRKKIRIDIVDEKPLAESLAMTMINTLNLDGGKVLSYTKGENYVRVSMIVNQVVYELIKDFVSEGFFEEIIEEKKKVLILK